MLLDGPPGNLQACLGFAVAALLAWLLVPAAERLAWRIGAIDLPRERSLHTKPTPKLGGLAILVGVCVAGYLFLPEAATIRAILGGATAIALVGALDDVFEFPPALKLLGQIIAASIPVAEGVAVGVFTLPFVGGVDPAATVIEGLPLLGDVNLGEIFTVVGIVAFINVINLIDGVDGLAAGVCLISALALAVIALSLDRRAAGVLAALTAGAALGFLRHGFPPASSFMGDTGSNLLGYLLGVIAVQGALKTNAVVALFFPLIVLAVPILDTSFVVAKRLKHRRPIYQADRWHFHHRLANIGFSQRRTLLYMYGWTLAMAGLALALRFVPYSDDRGHFDATWTAVMITIALITLIASAYLLLALEILKLRTERLGWLTSRLGSDLNDAAEPSRFDRILNEGVARELETGSFPALDPETGEFEAVGHP